MPDNVLQSKLLRVAAIVMALVGAVAIYLTFGQGSILSQDSGARQDLPPPAKRTDEQSQADIRATALAMPTALPDYGAPIPTVEQQAPYSPIERQPAGDGTIVETGFSPFRPTKYLFQNQWQIKTEEYTLIVYAGIQKDEANPTDLSQGVLVVQVIPAQGFGKDILKDVPPGVYPSAQKGGALRIVGAEGMTLKVASAGGTSYSFDVASRNLILSSTAETD
jgi:hypothetical protein